MKEHKLHSPEYLEGRRGASEKVRKNRHTTLVVLGAAALASGATMIIANPFKVDRSYERATEDCVSDLAGRRVDLIPNSDPTSIHKLQMPASVYAEQLACERNNNNVQAAKEALAR